MNNKGTFNGVPVLIKYESKKMSKFFLSMTQQKILIERQPKSLLFFDCVSIVIIEFDETVDSFLIGYEFATRYAKQLEHIKNASVKKNKIVLS